VVRFRSVISGAGARSEGAIQVTHCIARCSLVTGIFLLIGAAAFAQTDNPAPEKRTAVPPTSSTTMQPVPWQRGARFRMDCGQDLHRLCYGVQPGEGRLIQCLLSHRGELSPTCMSRVAAARSAPGVAPLSYPNARSPGLPSAGSAAMGSAALRASCGPDVQRLCAGITSERGGVIRCLNTHRIEVSPPCVAFLNEMLARRAAQKNAPVPLPPKTPHPAGDSSASPVADNPTATPTDGPAATGAPPADDSSATTSPVANSPAATPANNPVATDALHPANSSAATSPVDSSSTNSKAAPSSVDKRPVAKPATGALAFPL
jgi:hypothetical protein